MHHRRSRSDPDIDVTVRDYVPPDKDASDDDAESVSDSSESIYTVDLYSEWRLPDLNFSVKLPGWFVLLVTVLLFRGPSTPPSCVA
jgi:hypothetical protein